MGLIVGLLALSVTVLVQFAGIVWFAATMRSNQLALQVTLGKVQEIVTALHEFVTGLDKRVSLLEYIPPRGNDELGRRKYDQ